MKISSSQYGKALIDALEESAPEKRDVVIDNFFALLIKDNAMRQAGEIMAYIEMYDKKEKGIEDVSVVTAFPLTEDVRTKITKKMGDLIGRKIILNESVDKNIIGGVIIKFNDYLFDGSVLSRIRQFGKSLIS